MLVETVTENDALDDLTPAKDFCDGLLPDCDTHLLLLANGSPNNGKQGNATQLWKSDPDLSGKLRQLFDNLRPDIVHTHKLEELVTVSPAARQAGVPQIVHSLCGEIAIAEKRQMDKFAKVIMDLSPLLIAPSEKVADKLPPSARVEIVPMGIDCDRYTPGDQTRARRQIGLPAAPRMIGCASPASSLRTLLYAIFQMEHDVHLALFGKARPGATERDLIRRLGLEERVHVLGAWAKPEQAFQAIDVYFHGPAGDCLPRAVLAAQACGKSVIACAPTPNMVLCPQTGRLAPTEFTPTLLHSLRCTLKSAEPEITRKFVTDKWNLAQTLEGHGALFRKLTKVNPPTNHLT